MTAQVKVNATDLNNSYEVKFGVSVFSVLANEFPGVEIQYFGGKVEKTELGDKIEKRGAELMAMAR